MIVTRHFEFFISAPFVIVIFFRVKVCIFYTQPEFVSPDYMGTHAGDLWSLRSIKYIVNVIVVGFHVDVKL